MFGLMVQMSHSRAPISVQVPEYPGTWPGRGALYAPPACTGGSGHPGSLGCYIACSHAQGSGQYGVGIGRIPTSSPLSTGVHPPPRHGPGSVRSMRLLYQLRGQSLTHWARAVLVTARTTVATSTGTLSWSIDEARFANSSALSFPGRPQWDGTHCRQTLLPWAAS